MAPLTSAVDRLRVVGEALLALQPAVEAGAPWPPATHFGVEPEAAWGPPEVLAHVAEMLSFWLGEVERALDPSAEPVPVGRVQVDTVRLGLIERDRTLPPRELFGRVEVAIGRLARRLPELSDAEVARRGVLPSGVEITVGGLVEHFLVAHLEEHEAQLRATLADRAG